MNSLLAICLTEKKSLLSTLCKKTTISQEEFANFIVASEGGLLPWLHKISYRDFIPEHLRLTEADRTALVGAKGGEPAPRAAQKSLTKTAQIFEQRRYLVGHLFYTPTLTNWHLFYFDQRDTEQRRPNHWQGGSHLHLVNCLWPKHDCQTTWSYFNSGN
jgi:hypothetical protein